MNLKKITNLTIWFNLIIKAKSPDQIVHCLTMFATLNHLNSRRSVIHIAKPVIDIIIDKSRY